MLEEKEEERKKKQKKKEEKMDVERGIPRLPAAFHLPTDPFSFFFLLLSFPILPLCPALDGPSHIRTKKEDSFFSAVFTGVEKANIFFILF